MIETDGEAVGQVNGLRVPSIGTASFGQLARITVRARMSLVAGTPSDHSHLMKLNQPVVRARYGSKETAESGLNDLVHQFAFEKALERTRSGFEVAAYLRPIIEVKMSSTNETGGPVRFGLSDEVCKILASHAGTLISAGVAWQ